MEQPMRKTTKTALSGVLAGAFVLAVAGAAQADCYSGHTAQTQTSQTVADGSQSTPVVKPGQGS
jgi:hypothetical protein